MQYNPGDTIFNRDGIPCGIVTDDGKGFLTGPIIYGVQMKCFLRS